jgi:tRNA threonylcarbamoyladenosine biosynthesis protein TsaB
MKILAIDTSGPVCGAAVLDGERVLSEYTTMNKNTHSTNLMPMAEAALTSAGCCLGDMEAIAAVTGPGSFTGVRIGVATAKGLAHGAGIPCIPVDALEALAASAGAFDGVICPIQDARAGQVYGAAFTDGERKTEDLAIRIEDFLTEIRKHGERFLFLGDGVAVHRETIRETLGESACFAAPAMNYLRPAAAGWLAMTRGEPVSYLELEARYLRPPNAQKNRKLMEAMGLAET